VAKGKAAEKDVKQRGKSDNVIFSKLDLASLQSVRDFSERTLEEEPRIDILINNAGVMIPPYATTKEGFELQFGVNHLGHFLLTNLLLERIKEAPAGRILNLSSRGHRRGKINFADLQSKQSYSRMGAYAQSKLANILFTQTLAKKLKETNVTTYSLHPGLVRTDLGRHIPWPAVVVSLSPSTPPPPPTSPFPLPPIPPPSSPIPAPTHMAIQNC
jgi:NAD(P)-dependent dehydrogenase (short-subunit alcohol dehydrogenase family)